MAQTGFGMGFDLDGLDKALRNADKGIQDLAKEAEVQTKRISDAFSLGATKGISQLSRELSDVKSGLAELTNKNYEIKLSSNNFGQEVIDEVNRVINYTRQEFERVNREKVSRFLIPDAPSQYNFGMNAPPVDLSSIDSIIARMNVLKEALDTGELNNRKVDDTLRVQINDETKALNEWLGVLKMSTDEFNAAKTAQARSILETAQMQIDATNAEIKRREDEKAAKLKSISEEATEEMKYQQRMLEVRQAANEKQQELLRNYESSLKEVRSLEAQQMTATDVFVNSKDNDKIAMAREVYYGIEEELNMHKQRMIAIEEKYPVETQLIKEQDARREFIRQSEEDIKESERRKAEIIAQNQQAKSNNQNYQQQWKEQADAYVALFDEAIKREEKNKADARNYELQGFLELQNKKKQSEADMRSIEQRNHAEKLKEYEEMFAALDRTEKRRKAIYNATADSSQGATHYADRVLSSQKPKTVENLQKAISRAQEAQKRLNLDTEEGKKKYAQLSETIKKCELEIKKATWSSKNFNNANDELSKTATRLKQTLVAAFSVSSLFGYAKKVMEVRGEFEMQHKAMQVLIGDQFKANKLWEQTVQLAVKSPFRVKELVTYTKQLSAYRIETELLHDKTKMLSDISAGLGVDMNRLILAYGQVKAANYLRGTELRQFSEAGINVLQELSEYFTEIEGRAVSVGDVFERVSKRMVSFADVDAVLQKVTSEGGEFYKMQEKQSETLQGMLRNLTDSIDLMMNEIGKSNEGMTKGALSAVKTLIDHWRFFAEMLKGGVVALSITLTIKSLNSMSRSMYKAAASAKTFSVTNNKLANSFKRLTVSVRSLTKAMLANPLFWKAAAITAGLAILSLIRAHNKEVKAANKIYEEAAANELNRSKRLQDLSESISANNAVIKKGEVNTKEYAKAVESNKSLLKELNKEYPTLSSQIKTNGDNTIELTDAVKEHNKQLRENIALQYQAKGSFFQDDLSTNYQDVIKEQADVQKAIENTKGAAQAFASQLEFSYQQELVDDKQYKKFKQLADAIYEAKDAADIRDLDLSIISDVTRDMGKSLKGSAKDLASELRTLVQEMHGEATAYLRLQGNIDNQQSSIKNSIKSINNEVERGVWVENYLNQFNIVDNKVREWAKEVIKKMVEVTIVYPEKGDEDKSLEPWAERVKEAITEVNNKIKKSNKDIADTELFPLPNAGQTREQYLEVIKPFLEIAKAEYAVGQKIVDDSTIAQTKALKPYADAVERILNIMKKTSEENEALQILKKQIKLIRDAARAYDEMRKLHDEAYAEEHIYSEYGAAFKEAGLGNISGYEFGTREDELNNLNKLKSSAASVKGGMLELSKATAQVGVQVDNLNQEITDQKLFDEISKLFSNYEISLEMDKLNIPKDLASKLFGFEAIDLDDIRGKVLEEFGMGDMAGKTNEQIYDSNAYKEMSQKRRDELKKALEEEESLQNDYLQNNLKKYIEYTKKQLSAHAEIKHKEYKQLAEIEKTFAPKSEIEITDDMSDEDKAKYEAQNEQIRERNKILAEQKELAIEAVNAQAQNDVKQLEWDNFRSSDVYINLFNDLDKASDEVINKAIERIEEFKKEWEDMPVQAAKEMFEKLTMLQGALADTQNVRKDKRAIEQELNTEMESRGIKHKSTTQQGRDELRSSLTSSNVDLQAQIDYENQRVAILQLINSQSQELTANDLERLGYTQQMLEYYGIGAEELGNSVGENEKLIKSSKTIVQNTQQQINNNNRLYNLIGKQEDKTRNIRESWVECLNTSNDLLGSFADLGDSIDAAFGTDIISDTAETFIDMGSSMLTAVANAISLQVQLAGVEAGALAAGTAMNSMLGIIGWIVMAVQLLVSLFTAIAKMDEKKNEARREKEIAQAERLKNEYEDLVYQFERYEKAFNRISAAFDKAYTLEQKRAQRVAGKQNLEEQKKLLEEQERVNKERIAQLEASNAAEQQLKDKKQDKDYIENNNREIAELINQQDELNDKKLELLEAEREWQEAFVDSFGGTYDYASIAEEWVDAWMQAFEESGNGLDALEDKFDDFIKNMIKKQVVYKGASKIMEGLMNVVNDAIGEDGDITQSEWAKILKESEETYSDLDNFLKNYVEMLEGAGISLSDSETTLSGLQKGIQGITEDQAEILSAYWNSVRLDVSAIRRAFESYISAQSGTYVNPMLEPLKSIKDNTANIHKLLDSVVGESASGAGGVRVYVKNWS